MYEQNQAPACGPAPGYKSMDVDLAPMKETELHRVGHEFQDMASGLHSLVNQLESRLLHVLHPIEPSKQANSTLRKQTVSGLEPLLDAKESFQAAGERIVSILQRIGI